MAIVAALIAIQVLGSGTPITATETRLDGVAVRFPELAPHDGGSFLMGSPVESENAYQFRKCEKPQRETEVKRFWLGRFIITAEEFCVFLNDEGCENPSMFDAPNGHTNWATIVREAGRFAPRPNMERCPAYPVTWRDAEAYCRWLSLKLGHPFRLPTETEWEFAARGVELRRWPWGDEPPLIDRSRHAAWIENDWLKSEHGQQSAEFEERLAEYGLSPEEVVRRLGLDEYVARQRGQFELDPTGRELDPPDRPAPIYELYGERWIHDAPTEGRGWLNYPVGSFPRNATPQRVYDMLAYPPGQWCADPFEWHPKSDSEWDHDSGRELRIVRGAHHVVIDRDTYARVTPLFIKFIGLEGGPAKMIEGRSWSRRAQDAGRGALLRLATSDPPR